VYIPSIKINSPYLAPSNNNPYMAIIAPFKALRPAADLAAKLASKPYDVLNSAEAREIVKDNPLSFLHITKAEVSLPEQIDIHSPQVYEKAKQNLEAFIRKDILFRELKPCYYIYALTMNGKTQTGLVAGSAVEDYNNNIIKKHEFTRPEKENDRIEHMKACGAQTGNVFLAYKNVADIDNLINQWIKEKSAVYHFTADDDIQHAIWVVNDDATIAALTDLFATQVPVTYIADGHHRAASAAKLRNALGYEAPEEADFFLTTLFPSNQLQILDYNRLVKDTNALTIPKLLTALKKSFKIKDCGKEPVKPSSLHEFGMYVAGTWYQLIAKPNMVANTPMGVLDVTILSDLVLDKILGIADQRTDNRVDFVGGIRGLEELQKRVDSQEMAIAFSLYPVSIEQLFAIADSGQVMPPKSTWFEPKLRDGLLTHLMNN
jgi:uncharacterized protein (DUF1015 family)